MAPPLGLEPRTLRLTAECSAIELQGIGRLYFWYYTVNAPLSKARLW